MAERSVVPRKMCLPITDRPGDVTAAALVNPGMSAWLALTWRAQLAPGGTVLILGATGIAGQLRREAGLGLAGVDDLDDLVHAPRAPVSIRTVGNPIVLDVETENGGLVIGRRGDTLSALQYIVNVLVGKRTRRWTKVVVDVERWRERREETLRALALRQAERVRHQRRPIALDPMPANERRIIHLALQGHRDVDTHSEGEEPNRRLIITPKR